MDDHGVERPGPRLGNGLASDLDGTADARVLALIPAAWRRRPQAGQGAAAVIVPGLAPIVEDVGIWAE